MMIRRVSPLLDVPPSIPSLGRYQDSSLPFPWPAYSLSPKAQYVFSPQRRIGPDSLYAPPPPSDGSLHILHWPPEIVPFLFSSQFRAPFRPPPGRRQSPSLPSFKVQPFRLLPPPSSGVCHLSPGASSAPFRRTGPPSYRSIGLFLSGIISMSLGCPPPSNGVMLALSNAYCQVSFFSSGVGPRSPFNFPLFIESSGRRR